jgi:hypothetical protein
MHLIAKLLLVATILPTALSGQGFPATQGPNLPSSETVSSGQVMFEIAHRFLPPFSDGSEALWGLDGPALYRLGLAYGVSDRFLVGLLRSNLEDNMELNAKVRILDRDSFPVQVAVMAGVAWNTEVAEVEGAEDGESQQYLQVIVDAGLGERATLGIVPSLLRNPRIRDADAETAFALGVHGHVELSEGIGVIGEWLFSEPREELGRDSGAFGLEFSTRGHTFKLLATNQVRLSPTQFLAGATVAFEPDAWRLGFNITRVLAF